MPQIEKPDDLQSIANPIRFFFICMTLSIMEIAKKSLAANSQADLSGTAFGKSSADYGHIDENGSSVRKWPARKMVITDKMGKNGRLSVKIQAFRTRFYGQITGKCRFVRKMRFAYGQIIKKGSCVRKFE